MNNSHDYPASLIRGIARDNFLHKDRKSATVEAYSFSKAPNSNNFHELSINWLDSEGKSVDNLLAQEKDGKLQFEAGYTKALFDDLLRFSRKGNVREYLSYERAELPDNEWHGNILIHEKTDKIKKKEIIAVLAVSIFSEFISRNNQVNNLPSPPK